MIFQLFNTCTRKREGYLEVISVLLYHLQQGVECWHIRTLCYVADASFVLIVIIIIMIGADIKETISLQMDNLMYLEI